MEDRKDGSKGDIMQDRLPSQVDKAGKRSQDLLKLHKEGKGPGDIELAPDEGQDRQPQNGDAQKKLTDLQAKYGVLEGKYSKEIENADLKDLQRLQNEVATLKRQNGELQKAMQSAETLVKEVREELDKKKAAPEKTLDPTSVLSDEDREHLEAEDLGGKTLEILMKLSRAAGGSAIEGQLTDIATQVKTTAERIDKTEQRIDQTEQTQSNVTLKSVIPDFEAVNSDPKFHEWLDEPVNEFSMRKKRDDLQDAMGAGNLETVKAGIDAFKKQTKWGKKTPKTPAIEPDESFVGGDGNDAVTGPKRDYTMAQVTKFYLDQTKGKWVGREKEAQALDTDIQLAIAQERIKP